MVGSNYWFYAREVIYGKQRSCYLGYRHKDEFIQELHTGDFVTLDDKTYRVIGIVHVANKECNVYLSEPYTNPINAILCGDEEVKSLKLTY